MLNFLSSKNRIIVILSGVFFLSGAAALIYQVAWQRLLTVYYGVGSISIALIVSVYMAGLGLGALWGGSLAERLRQRLLFYFFIELLIGGFGVASPFLLDSLGRYTAGSSYVVSFACMAGFLFIPTVLMGMTLPVLTKIFNQVTRDFFDTVSFLYFVNTLGAAVGALAASYGLITFGGLDIAVYSAAGINFFLAVMIFWVRGLSGTFADDGHFAAPAEPAPAGSPWGRAAFLFVLVTGFLAIGYEIVWLRVTSFLVKVSPYAFSSALAVYLFGIALGSFAMNRYLRRRPGLDRGRFFLLLQLLIGGITALIFIGYYYATKFTVFAYLSQLSFHQDVHPLWSAPLKFIPVSPDNWFRIFFGQIDIFFWPVVFIFVPTLLMGASFPLIASLAWRKPNEEGRAIGRIYALNIAGNVLGGVVTGFVLLPFWGTEITILLFAVTGIMMGAAVVLKIRSKGRRLLGWLTAFSLLVFIIAFLPKSGQLYTSMHFPELPDVDFYFEEGVDGVVGTFVQGEAVRNYIQGNQHGGRPGHWYNYQAIEAMSLAPRIDNVLVIGYGTGSTVETLLKSPEVKKITLVELNRTLIKNLRKIPLFDKMLADPRVELVIEDGRRFLLRSREKYDLVLMDPLRSTTVYSNNLYSRDFFRILKERLAPQGVFEMWTDEYDIILYTLVSEFSDVRIYGTFFVVSNCYLEMNNNRLFHLVLATWPQNPGTYETLRRGGHMRYLGLAKGFSREGAVINTDWRPHAEYFLGRDKKITEFCGGTQK